MPDREVGSPNSWKAKLAAGDRRPGEFLETVRYDLGRSRDLRVHTEGDVDTPPAGSTLVDFAYAVHAEVGNRCIGARANGGLVALER